MKSLSPRTSIALSVALLLVASIVFANENTVIEPVVDNIEIEEIAEEVVEEGEVVSEEEEATTSEGDLITGGQLESVTDEYTEGGQVPTEVSEVDEVTEEVVPEVLTPEVNEAAVEQSLPEVNLAESELEAQEDMTEVSEFVTEEDENFEYLPRDVMDCTRGEWRHFFGSPGECFRMLRR